MRVLVTRYRGDDAVSEQLGDEAGLNLSQELREYFKTILRSPEVQGIGLGSDDLQVQYVPCVLTQHQDARAIGQAWHADLVFWGQAACSLTDRECQQMAAIVAKEWKKQLAQLPPALVVNGDVVQNVKKGGQGRVGTTGDVRPEVTVPQGAVLRTSVTVVAWRGLEARGAAQELQRPVEVLELDFPRLASSRGLALFHFALGAYAARAGFHGLALASFEQAEGEITRRKSGCPS